jgi:CheY-like chemotaxis protein
MKKLKNIVLVDDDSISNTMNEMVIKEMGVAEEVVTCKNGQEALQFVEKSFAHHSKEGDRPADTTNLILLDLNMPGMDGFEFLEEFSKLKKADRESTPIVIILSSSSHEQDVEKAINYKISGYLTKPLTQAKIKAIVDRFAYNDINL